MERKKLLLILGIAFAVVLTGIIVLVSVLTTPAEEAPEPTPTETAQVDEERDPDDGAEVIVDPGEEDEAPRDDIYANDYSNDEGYAPLPEGFQPTETNTKGTVYDEEWALNKYTVLLCELSKKETVTEKAIQPLQRFADDLAGATHPNAQPLRDSIYYYLKDYEIYMGERAPASTRNILTQMCNANNLDWEDQ
jgi:hypothetical protein